MDFLRGSSFWNEAVYSGERDSFRAGTGIFISPRITPLVQSHGIIMPRRAQYLTFQLAPDMVIGIINIYAHNFTNSKWIVAGDFNMVEDLEDKRGGTESTGQGHLEFQAWTAMLLQLQLLDIHYLDEFRQLTNIKYTWVNRRHGPESIISRLDRFYVSPRLQAIGGQSGVWRSTPHMSDHSPVFLKLRRTGNRIKYSQAFNKGLLKTEEGRAELLAAWRQAMTFRLNAPYGERIADAVAAVKTCSDQITRRRRQESATEFEAQFEDVFEAELDLHANWQDEHARRQLNYAQAHLHKIRQERMEKKYERQTALWS
ncbi:hypothetical protein KC19_7G013300 [Ceratodon purpureus]|uniref:Endonuclease/exonuclease/phosphatase domain-containing protein n=1 Tax=Ceratodon purpureus TaxID=3225 RepID=A0A8T0H372_CERPU|nr:hypothetical protein KC19_7G013300 [Ceratodon purpureus]